MYVTRLIKVEVREAIRKFVSDVGFAKLVTPSDSGLKVTHMPLLYVYSPGERVISGHMANGNDYWRTFDGETESVVIFQGPNAYVSTQWYESKSAVLTSDYGVVRMLGGVVGFQMAAETVEAKLKLSQNRSEEDRRRVAEKLGSSRDGQSIAAVDWTRQSDRSDA